MNIKFLKQITAEFVDHRDDVLFQEPYDVDKTFYHNQIVEVDRLEETARGFVDLIFKNGDAAVGINKQFIQIIKE